MMHHIYIAVESMLSQNAAHHVRSDALVVKLMRDLSHFNVILGIHEKQMHVTPH